MIVGSGSIAKSIEDREDIIFFASGVSDSSCRDEREYDREIQLFKRMPINQHIVYFSSLEVFYKDTRYAKHKRYMEDYIRDNFKTYTIVRIEAPDWTSTPTTIINHFRDCIKKNIKPNIQDTTRYVVSLDEFLYWMNLIKPGTRSEMNILGRKMTIQQIYNEIKEGKL